MWRREAVFRRTKPTNQLECAASAEPARRLEPWPISLGASAGWPGWRPRLRPPRWCWLVPCAVLPRCWLAWPGSPSSAPRPGGSGPPRRAALARVRAPGRRTGRSDRGVCRGRTAVRGRAQRSAGGRRGGGEARSATRGRAPAQPARVCSGAPAAAFRDHESEIGRREVAKFGLSGKATELATEVALLEVRH